DPAAMQAYDQTNRLLEPFDLAAAFLDRDAVHRLEPALSHRVCGGWHHRTDSHLRPESLVSAWTRAVRAKGVAIEEECRLERLLTRDGRITAVHTTRGRFTADRYILAAGAWAPLIGRQIGLRLPVQPGKGYSITMERPAVCPQTPCYLYERNVVVTPWKSGYRLGGTMEFSGFDTSLNQARLDKLEQAAAVYFKSPPAGRVTERWTGLRPMCVDDLPIIDRAPALDNLYIAAGHGMLGLTAATGTGRLIADMIIGRPPAIDPEPFSIKRFAVG
ncbi:MAG TPA: FAD-dependent oxidoreductase, partial [Desulfosarcina sp.]|nr:FAD-dependent oxidoreductase [Desulfosarcina sp.]